MSFISLELTPGINTQLSPNANPQGYSNSQNIRWMWGKPQKRGGFQQLTPVPLVGTCRGMHAWGDQLGIPYLACGTEQRLQVFTQGNILDITPIRLTTNNPVNFSTVINTPTVTIIDTASGTTTGDWVNINVIVSVGGLIIQGFYQVTTIDANTYTITAASNATATVNNGGAVPLFNTTISQAAVNVTLNNHGYSAGSLFPVEVSTTVGGITMLGTYSVTSVTNSNVFVITPGPAATSTASGSENGGNANNLYLLHSGFAVNTAVSGYGIGPYGQGLYGIGSGGQIIQFLRQWFLDNWGQDMIGNPNAGAIYIWPPTNVNAPATVVATAPQFNTASFVIAQAQILVCLGAESGGTQFLNLVRWSDVGDFTSFTPTATNQAGSFQIPTGSKIVGGMAVGLGALIWTDTDLYSMTYQGLPFVFDFQRISTNCEMISGHSAGVIGQRIVWPSIRGFFQYDGSAVTPLPCPVWDFMFENIDLTQQEQVCCGTNTLFNEMSWYFPTTSLGVCYITYNTLENTWDKGILTRTAWTDHSPIGNPVGADQNGLLQQHEIGYDANGIPAPTSITTGLAALGDGENFWFIDWIIPDLVTGGTSPTLSVTVLAANYPGDTPQTFGPFTMTNTTEYIPVRIRARLVGLQVSSNDLGTFWRWGKWRVRFGPAGRR